MLLLALALCLVGVAALATASGRAESAVLVHAAGSQDHSLPEAWRAAALSANADAKDLRVAIASALDERDARCREKVLRAALARTSGPVPVRVTL